MRLHKYIAEHTALSRRAAEKAIAEGLVMVNGNIVTQMGVVIEPGTDIVALEGKCIQGRGRAHRYLAFYKPRRTMITRSDPQGRRTIWDVLGSKGERLNAVGRLDYDTEGLLLLTDDGDLLQRLTHPSFGIKKVYHVKVKGLPGKDVLQRMVDGMKNDGENLRAERMRVINRTAQNTWIELVLHSGKYRQVRRMCETLGAPVLKLKRVMVGNVRLGTMRSGEVRRLRPTELKNLRGK